MYKAKKQFGQNFLKDKSYIRQIIQAIPNNFGLEPDSQKAQLVEIGIGLGDLTQELAKLDSVLAYEIDSDLCSLFLKNFAHKMLGVKLVNCDVLSLPNAQGWLFESDYILVSNLPYYIATHIICRALRDEKCRALVVMTQKEVAQKFCATSKNSDFCALSVLAQSFGRAQLLFEVPPIAFQPAPKVTSAVFRIVKFSEFNNSDSQNVPRETFFKQNVSPSNLADFENFLKIAFCAPRKKLAKNLETKFNGIGQILDALQIAQNSRPHELTTAQYHQIFSTIRSQNESKR